jgi:hypothetical protein
VEGDRYWRIMGSDSLGAGCIVGSGMAAGRSDDNQPVGPHLALRKEGGAETFIFHGLVCEGQILATGGIAKDGASGTHTTT